MRKFLSATLTLALVLCIGMAGATAACAGGTARTETEAPPQRLTYIQHTITSLNISGGQATCVGSVTGYYGLTTKVTITLYLERKTAGSNTWTTYASDPKQTFNSFTGMYQMKKSVTSGYQYRVRAEYVAYAGSNWEALTGYSGVMSY